MSSGASKPLPLSGVTAIVPTFNRERYLPEALDSLLGQSTRPDQIIVVDDGSTDGTRHIVEAYALPVQYVRKSNGGKSSALNVGLELALGEYIWIFDDDDVAHPQALERMVAALRSNPAAGFAYGDFDSFRVGRDGKSRTLWRSLPAPEPCLLHTSLLERCCIMQPALLVRKLCYEEVGAFNEQLVRSQDYEMALRLARRFRGEYVSHILYHMRVHAGERGAGGARFSEMDRPRMWRHYNQQIFRAIYRSYDLAEYVPPSCGEVADPSTEVTALIARACVMGRRDLWSLSTGDLGEAARKAVAAGRKEFNALEYALLSRMLNSSSHGVESVAEAAQFLPQLRNLHSRTFEAEVRGCLIWGLARRGGRDIRSWDLRDLMLVVRAFRTVATTGGLAAFVRRLLVSLGRRTGSLLRQRSTSPSQLADPA